MTDDFDAELRSRLARLSAAVPLRGSGSMVAVPAAPVRRGWGSARVSGGLIPVLAILVVGAVVASVARVGPFAPAATGGGPVTSTVVDGDFALTLTSAKTGYALREAIDVTASLTYRGSAGSVSIAHGHGGPMAFGVIERVGGIFLTPAWRGSCGPSVLERDIPLVQPFAKSGSFAGDNPAASDAAGFFEDPTLVLPAGAWHLYVVADFGIGDCGVDRHLMRVDLEIFVQDGPVPNASPRANPPQSVTVRDGDFELTIRSSKTRYARREPIEVSASLVYRGPKDSVDVWPGTVEFESREQRGETRVGFIHTLMCSRSTLQRDVAADFVLVTSTGVDVDPVARLAEGIWHLYAAATSCNRDPDAAQFDLRAEIEIEVEPALDPAPQPTVAPADRTAAPTRSQIELLTSGLPAAGSACEVPLNSGLLIRDLTSGFGMDTGSARHPVQWPFGYSAWEEGGVAFLLNEKGVLVAREGQSLSFGGYHMEGSVLVLCGPASGIVPLPGRP